MLCQNCGKNEVTFRYTQVVNGVKKEMNLCDNCASELGLKDINFSMPISFSSFLSDFFNDYSDSILPSFIGTRQLQCDNCGTTFDDFLNTGVFGCDECYDTFEDRIEPLIRKIQGSNKHKGRGYKNNDPKSKVNTGSNKKVEIKEKKDGIAVFPVSKRPPEKNLKSNHGCVHLLRNTAPVWKALGLTSVLLLAINQLEIKDENSLLQPQIVTEIPDPTIETLEVDLDQKDEVQKDIDQPTVPVISIQVPVKEMNEIFKNASDDKIELIYKLVKAITF